MTIRVTEQEGPDCILCAVRALTEGQPKGWMPSVAGEKVSGVILRVGTLPSQWRPESPVLFVDLWVNTTESFERVRVLAYSGMLDRALRLAEGQVGDRLTITYEGEYEVSKVARFAGRSYRSFTVDVMRGHHA